MIKQADAVVNAVQNILGDRFTRDVTVAVDILTKDDIVQICAEICSGIEAGEIVYNKPFDTTEVARYVPGMVKNHLRKKKALTGGKAYKPSKEGTKRDKTLKQLNLLLNSNKYAEGTDEHNAILNHIEERKGELEVERASRRAEAKKTEVDTDLLPDSLRQTIADLD